MKNKCIERSCMVTRAKLPKNQLIRFVNMRGELEIDLSYKKEGRGCYLVRSMDAFDEAIKRKLFQKQLRIQDIEMEKLLRLRGEFRSFIGTIV